MAHETSSRFQATFRNAQGTLRSGLTVVLSGSVGTQTGAQVSLLEDVARPGMYTNEVPVGVYDVYINGTKDDELSPLHIGGGVERYSSEVLSTLPSTAFRAQAGMFVPYLEGAGKVTVLDGDFGVTPLNGALAITHDSSTGDLHLHMRGNGAWQRVSTGSSSTVTGSAAYRVVATMPSHDPAGGTISASQSLVEWIVEAPSGSTSALTIARFPYLKRPEDSTLKITYETRVSGQESGDVFYVAAEVGEPGTITLFPGEATGSAPAVTSYVSGSFTLDVSGKVDGYLYEIALGLAVEDAGGIKNSQIRFRNAYLIVY